VLFVLSAFDECIRKFRVYKVETIGDSYVVTSGLPQRIGNQHAQEMANMALDLLATSTRFSLPGHSSERLPLRIGINCGKRAFYVSKQITSTTCLNRGDYIFSNT